MKSLIVCGVIAAVSCVSAAVPAAKVAVPKVGGITTNAPAVRLSRQEREALHQKVIMERHGGLVAHPGTQQGSIVYVDCQKKVDAAWLKESIDYMKIETKFNVLYKAGKFDISAPKIEGNASLFIVDDPNLPVLLCAPESRWALVNVAPITKEERPAFRRARVMKEISRAFAYLCGAASSQFEKSLMRAITKQADLDQNFDYYLPLDVVQRFRPYMEKFGVKPALYATYRKACQDGWAAQPTNEFQKAIWNQVHEVPKKPIKIEYDPKKGE